MDSLSPITFDKALVKMWLTSVFEIEVDFVVYNVTMLTLSCKLLCQLHFGNYYGEHAGTSSEPCIFVLHICQ